MSRPNSTRFPTAILSRHSDEPIGRYGEPDAIGYAMHRSRSHDAVIRVYGAGRGQSLPHRFAETGPNLFPGFVGNLSTQAL